MEKCEWSGRVVSVQPRIRLMRPFDERYHSYQGYALRVDGTCEGGSGKFRIAVGTAAHDKYQFRVGMELNGMAVPVPDPRLETAGFYKASDLKVLKNAESEQLAGPLFQGVHPDLEAYSSRGHRRLDARTYDIECGMTGKRRE